MWIGGKLDRALDLRQEIVGRILLFWQNIKNGCAAHIQLLSRVDIAKLIDD